MEKAPGAGRHGHHAGAARRGAGRRQEGHAGDRLGARRPGRAGEDSREREPRSDRADASRRRAGAATARERRRGRAATRGRARRGRGRRATAVAARGAAGRPARRRPGPAGRVRGDRGRAPRRRVRQPGAAGDPARGGAARPGRRVRHRADLRHAAPTWHPRRDPRPTPPAGTWRGSTRRPATRCGSGRTSCCTPGCRRTPRSSSTVDLVRSVAPGATGFANAVLREVAEPGPRRLGGEARPGDGDRPGRAPGAGVQPPAVDRAGLRRGARRRPGRDRAAADRGQRAAAGAPVRPARAWPTRWSWPTRSAARPGAFSPYAVYLSGGAPGDLPAVRRRPGPRPGRGLPAGGDRAGRRAAGRPGRPLAGPVRRARAARPACSARWPRSAAPG